MTVRLPGKAKHSQPSPWDLDTPLLWISQDDLWTIRDACEGVQVFGGIGSGKTSGSGAALARAFLRSGFGGLVCCAKPEERVLWTRHAHATGRAGDLVIVRPGQHGVSPPWRCNFLRYELDRCSPGGGQTENAVSLLTSVVEIVENRQGQDGGDPFWTRATKELIRNAVDALTLAGAPLTLDAICDLIASAPTEAPQPPEWRTGPGLCASVFRAIQAQVSAGAYTPAQIHTLEVTGRYWLQSFATLNAKTRSSITATFTSIADTLLRGLAWELLGTDTNVVPEVTYQRGVILVLDLSIQEYREAGRIVQGIWKRLFQEAVLRRDPEVHPRPVFLWCDESQHFISPFDYEYQSTARSARACTVYLTQNISNYHARLGVNARSHADALLGLFATKIFHSNADATTNQYAADLIGKRWGTRRNRSAASHSGGGSFTFGQSENLEYKVEPAVFPMLRKGGATNGYQVDSVLFQAGRVWQATGDTFALAAFDQRDS